MISTAVHWAGVGNSYLRRGSGLVAKSTGGPYEVYVALPRDWLRQQLGEEIKSTIVAGPVPLPTRPSCRRVANDYRFSTRQRSLLEATNKQVGADTRQIPIPANVNFH